MKEAEIQELEERTLREQKMRQMQIELNELSSRKSDSSIHSLQAFSWKDSASRISDWVDNVLTEDFTLDLQSADNVNFRNQQIQSDQKMKKKGDLSPAQNENDNFNKCLQIEAAEPVLIQNTTVSVKPKKILSYNPTAIFTPSTQTTMQPSVNQLIKLPKLTLPGVLRKPSRMARNVKFVPCNCRQWWY